MRCVTPVARAVAKVTSIAEGSQFLTGFKVEGGGFVEWCWDDPYDRLGGAITVNPGGGGRGLSLGGHAWVWTSPPASRADGGPGRRGPELRIGRP